MHLSGALLALTFLVPPAWALDTYGAAPADDPSADVPPFMILFAALFSCVTFHVLVQIPSGLLGSRLGRNRGALATYAFTLAVAGTLTLAFLWSVERVNNTAELLSLWRDFMARGSLALAGYVWLTSLWPGAGRRLSGADD
ncbi:hypothetical protein [Streptomyces sp. NPDC048611]|uniref:hypothetical protein n=1 Tax=unclassified Streptomyces TaxID=2593676 RepID=UPI00343B3A81